MGIFGPFREDIEKIPINKVRQIDVPLYLFRNYSDHPIEEVEIHNLAYLLEERIVEKFPEEKNICFGDFTLQDDGYIFGVRPKKLKDVLNMHSSFHMFYNIRYMYMPPLDKSTREFIRGVEKVYFSRIESDFIIPFAKENCLEEHFRRTGINPEMNQIAKVLVKEYLANPTSKISNPSSQRRIVLDSSRMYKTKHPDLVGSEKIFEDN